MKGLVGSAAQFSADCRRKWATAEEGSEGTSSFEDYEHNVDNLAIEVAWQTWSSEVISLFLEDWVEKRV